MARDSGAADGAGFAASSIASVCSGTWTVMMRPAWTRPSETLWRQTVITPVALTRR
jgi:hypothetical protein